MKRLKSFALAALAVFVAIAYIPTASVSAQSTGSSALSIAPKKTYIMDPGETLEDTISIRNLDLSTDLNLNLKVIDFTYLDDSGSPKLLLDENIEQTAWSLKPYLKIPDSISVKPSSNGTVKISLSIPKNLGAGSYYSAIIYSTGAPDGGNVGLSASGVTLVFVTVPGKVKEDLRLKKFGPYNPDKTYGDGYSFITGTEPKYMGYTIENLGNITAAPVGSIQIKNLFFGQTINLEDVNPKKSLALIGQTRTFDACIKLETNQKSESNTTRECVSPGLWPGLYKASIDLFYGQNGNNTNEITKTSYFWYLPLWFIIIVLILTLIIAFFIWRLVVMLKSKTRAPRGRRSSLMRRR